MTDSPKTEQPRYPSRRSLRLQRQSEESAATARATTDHTAPTSAPQEVHVPRVVHTPDSPATENSAAERAPRTLRAKLAATAAAASVGGLVLTLTLPAFAPPADAEATHAAGSVQQPQPQVLFSETSVDDMPSTFTTITASDSSADGPVSFSHRSDALVGQPFAQPVTLTDGFGYRTAPVAQFHDAQDYAAAQGTPILAIADGTVIEAGYASDGCGFGLKLAHEIDGTQVTSRYCHMVQESHQYAEGDELMMGDQVGEVGATGVAFGAHLHLAIRVDESPVDPVAFFDEYGSLDRKDGETTLPKTDPLLWDTDNYRGNPDYSTQDQGGYEQTDAAGVDGH